MPQPDSSMWKVFSKPAGHFCCLTLLHRAVIENHWLSPYLICLICNEDISGHYLTVWGLSENNRWKGCKEMACGEQLGNINIVTWLLSWDPFPVLPRANPAGLGRTILHIQKALLYYSDLPYKCEVHSVLLEPASPPYPWSSSTVFIPVWVWDRTGVQ